MVWILEGVVDGGDEIEDKMTKRRARFECDMA